MGLLSETEQQDMALAHGKRFSAVCDECGRCIPTGTIFIVLKYEKKKWEGPVNQKPFNWNLRIPKKIMCVDCNKEIVGEAPAKRIKIGGKGRKKLSKDEINSVNKDVRRTAIGILRKSEEPIEGKLFKVKLFLKLKKKDPKIKKVAINSTLRVLKKAKVLICKKRMWSLPADK